MSLQVEVISCRSGLVQMARQDEMFECGKGIVIFWPEHGASFIPATGEGKCGISYLRYIIKEYEQEYKLSSYKIEQAFFRLMLGKNYDRINVRLK